MGIKLIRKPELEKMIGVTERAIRRWEENGTFPKRILIDPNGRSVAWIEDEVLEWIASRAAARK